ncbi:hypothetical protein BC629DRAFT_1594768 [Irpex lacteus]|nr:hypothetical protein BC629DRAFT_1594768 [Irpex lacteus]
MPQLPTNIFRALFHVHIPLLAVLTSSSRPPCSSHETGKAVATSPSGTKTNTPPSSQTTKPPLSAVAAGKRKATPAAPVRVSVLLQQVLEDPRSLAALLSVLSLSTFHALISTCKIFRRVVAHPAAQDAILSRFVPGYQSCLGTSSPGPQIEISIEDLVAFNASQCVQLHHYPMHALTILGSPRYVPHIQPTDPITLQLVSMTQAHSRIVLLLQSLVHSAQASPYAYPDYDEFSPWPSSSPLTQSGSGRVRELVFPKPLFVGPAHDSQPSENNSSTLPTAGKAHRRASTASSASRSYSTIGPRTSPDFHQSKSSRGMKRFSSILGKGPKVPLPPPSDTPPAMNYYVGPWRKTLVSRGLGLHGSAVSEEELGVLPRPKFPARRVSSLNNSRESSLGGSSTPSSSPSRSPAEYSTDASSNDSPSPTPKDVPKFRQSRQSTSFPSSFIRPSASSPHDLSLATSRFRAPILRVFVPCTDLDEVAITACEEQLIASGLWNHLSAGDVVCNFGFVPLPEPEVSLRLGILRLVVSNNERQNHRRRWLMFNGYGLVHYIPPSPPPIENALTLPPRSTSATSSPLSDVRFILSLPPLPSPPPPSHSSTSPSNSNSKPHSRLSTTQTARSRI